MIKFVVSAALCFLLLLPAPRVMAGSDMPAADASQTSSATQATAPSAVIRLFYSQLLDTMKQGNKLGFTGRYKKLSPTIQSVFDLPLMTRISVGLVWSKASPQEQQALISAFSDFSIATYASRFTDFDGERFDVVSEKPVADGTMVETRIKPKDHDAVTINYLMHPDGHGSYRVVDVFLNGSISEIATRRAEFNSIVRRDGISALVNSLGEKSKQMGPS